MSQRNAILTAALLTSFVLVLIGGVVARVTQTSAAAQAAPTIAVSTEAATLAPEVQALINQREAQYQQALQDANAKLQQAYQQQQELAAQLAQQQQAQAQTQAQAPAYAVSPDMAASTALNAAPGATVIRLPELVNFQGAVAYEVTLDRGKVYVDANNGNVLYNGAAPTANAGQGGHDDGGHEDHEGGDD